MPVTRSGGRPGHCLNKGLDRPLARFTHRPNDAAQGEDASTASRGDRSQQQMSGGVLATFAPGSSAVALRIAHGRRFHCSAFWGGGGFCVPLEDRVRPAWNPACCCRLLEPVFSPKAVQGYFRPATPAANSRQAEPCASGTLFEAG